MNNTPTDRDSSDRSNGFTLAQTFANPSPIRSDSFSDAFGSEIAIEGNKVLVGARFDDTSGDNSGAAYLFNADNGNLDLTFSYPGLGERDTFGTQLALDGDRALIAADGDEDNGSFGSVLLFDTNNGNLLQTFTSPDSGSVIFGSAVAIDENNVLVGDRQNNTQARLGGAAFLFAADTGNSIQSFSSANPNPEDFFGASVAIEGNNLAISSRVNDEFGNKNDVVFIYDTDSQDLTQTLFSPNPNPESTFGGAIAIDAGRILIGALTDDTFGEDSGAAYLFDLENGNLLQTFSLPDPVGGELLGTDVDLQGDKVLIGARGDDTFGEDSGAAYLFNAESGDLVQSLFASTPEAGDDFGFSVGIDGDSLAVGAPGATDNGNEGGIVYLFEADFKPSNTISGTENSDRLVGTRESDNLLGEAGDDTIFGRGGNDLLNGGRGHDRLIGGGGADQYVLKAGDGNDTIIGYQDGTDSFLLAGGLTSEDLNITQNRGRTIVGVVNTAETLATLFGVDASNLNAEDFATVSVTDSNSYLV